MLLKICILNEPKDEHGITTWYFLKPRSPIVFMVSQNRKALTHTWQGSLGLVHEQVQSGRV